MRPLKLLTVFALIKNIKNYWLPISVGTIILSGLLFYTKGFITPNNHHFKINISYKKNIQKTSHIFGKTFLDDCQILANEIFPLANGGELLCPKNLVNEKSTEEFLREITSEDFIFKFKISGMAVEKLPKSQISEMSSQAKEFRENLSVIVREVGSITQIELKIRTISKQEAVANGQEFADFIQSVFERRTRRELYKGFFQSIDFNNKLAHDLKSQEEITCHRNGPKCVSSTLAARIKKVNEKLVKSWLLYVKEQQSKRLSQVTITNTSLGPKKNDRLIEILWYLFVSSVLSTGSVLLLTNKLHLLNSDAGESNLRLLSTQICRSSRFVALVFKATNVKLKIKSPIVERDLFLRAWSHKGYWFYAKKQRLYEVDCYTTMVSAGDVVLEVGAHIGFFTQLFEELTTETGRVIAVEPSSESFNLLTENTYSRTLCIPLGLLSYNGDCEMLNDCSYGGFVNSFITEFFDKKISGLNRSQMIDPVVRRTKRTITTLDDLCAKQNCNPDFLKIDAEGAELEILKGGMAVLQKLPACMIEVSLNHREVFEILWRLGFEAFALTNTKKALTTPIGGNVLFVRKVIEKR